jgi:predicted metal-binding membrane protein
VRPAPDAPTAPAWWRRENLAPGLLLLLVTALAWSYTLRTGSIEPMAMPAVAGIDADGSATRSGAGGMEAGPGTGFVRAMEPMHGRTGAADLIVFLFAWSVMMAAMMLPAVLPLLLLYRMTARTGRAAARMETVLAGYLGVWALAGLPVFAYAQLAATGRSAMTVLPGLLLVTGGAHQFTLLKTRCHTRCSSPLFFLAREWRPGVRGAVRLGLLHGLDCLGCCVGVMLALVALGMMNVAWMLTAAVIIFVEKTLPGGHRVARPLGIVLIAGGLFVLAVSLLGGRTMM